MIQTDRQAVPEPAPDPDPMARTDPRRRRARRRYKIRGPETWALIRESYLAGASARELARRYDVTEWAIWRRAWKGGWTKRDRVEVPPPPALGPLMTGPPVEVDAGALSREALGGVARALGQNRLDEARQLAQLAASLGRMSAEGAGGGGYTLNEMVRVLFDADYCTEVMTVDPDNENSPEKRRYWQLKREREDATGHRLAALRSEAYGEGRAELRAELGLDPEPDRPAEWIYYAGELMRASILDR